MKLPWSTVSAGLIVACGLAGQAGAEPAQPVVFNRDIRPILSDHCFACHGFDAEARKADLRLDVREDATQPHGDATPIVPGDVTASELVRRITSSDPDVVMPPPDQNNALSAEQIETIERWIAQGATYEQHWSFVTPTRPKLPDVSNADWPRNPIDRFILARLEAEGLNPGKVADKRTLIRRVTLDLTGLPPTPEEVAAFVADESSNAYEKLVDRLLASPRFGEHRARYWLDAARYGDTHGLHLDNYREMWPYRDWVIRAFNRNLPYDQFVTEQLAGDLLPNATLDQKIASGFNRAHITTNEGGSIKEEVYVRNVVDRVDTTGTIFMGLTLGCAVCHDHKYDPITSREFYSLFAIFNSLDDNPMDGNKKDYAPVVQVPSPEQKQRRSELKTQIASLADERKQVLAAIDHEDPGPDAQPPEPEPEEFVWVEDGVPSGARKRGPWRWVTAPDHPVFSGNRAMLHEAAELSQHLFEKASEPLKLRPRDSLFVYVYLDPDNPPKQIMLQWNDGSWNHRAYWGENKIPYGADKPPSRVRMGDLPELGKWVRLEVPVKKVGLENREIHAWAFTQWDGKVYWDKAGRVHRPERAFISFAAWVDHQHTLKEPTVPKNLAEAVKAKPDERKPEQLQKLRGHFLQHVHPEHRKRFEPLRKREKKFESDLKELNKQIPTTMISQERDKPKPAHILIRGEYDNKGEQVERAVPDVLPDWNPDLPRDRFGFAKWLIDPKHPLLARVTVNRFWQQLFGTGIVKTAEDFGMQGEPPSHPELLDWLAVQFIADGWDVKRTFKRMVMSATYRQSADVRPGLLEKDPANRLLARGPRFRLDAEVLRDQAMAISGLLVEKIGGAPVKPPQPEGLWKAVGYSSSNTANFKPDTEPEKVHRRSVYTFWKRTSPPPQMAIFDAPSREACRVRRERTNTPLQALVLMNDTQYVEAARALAELTMKQGGDTPEQRIGYMFQRATARPLRPEELKELLAFHADQHERFTGDLERARSLIAVGATKPDESLNPGELAAWTMVANLILNLDEVITKG